MSSSFSYASVNETEAALKRGGSARLIDVREPGEFESERVPGSKNFPLTTFTSSLGSLSSSDSIYVLCQVGARAAMAADILAQQGYPSVFVVSGGINVWKHEGLPTVKGERRVWPLERQVRFAAGLLVLTGLGLSFISRWFLVLSGFVGAGLTFSGVTGFCGMALILAKCPWNRK